MLPPLDWSAFLGTWTAPAGWLAVCLVASAGYLLGWRRGVRRGGHVVHPWRAVSFLLGMLVLALCMSSAVDGYAMALFWMHMIEHLTLITVVPALVVLGHPLTVLRESGGERWRAGFDRVVTRGPVAVLTHPAVGLVVYGVVIFYTHLTPFMDRMSMHPWLMTAEQVAYLVSGWMMLVAVIGEEPLRWRTPYLARLAFVVMALVPDTLVGIVLLQTPTNPFPMYMSMRPDWATPPLHDLDIGGSLMWAVGDGLMMCMAMGLVVSLITGRTRDRLLGPWLESVRSHTFDEHVARSGAAAPAGERAGTIDDDDAALDAYNEMLRRMNDSSRP
jgi:cytochrome c oxidase assembly factor CtaG